CRKGKQYRASCKKIEERTVREPLELLHMDLFGPVSVESINKKKYCWGSNKKKASRQYFKSTSSIAVFHMLMISSLDLLSLLW
ncbi:hypothetical protein Tco_1169527, partial [Tanacetum coccineum]